MVLWYVIKCVFYGWVVWDRSIICVWFDCLHLSPVCVYLSIEEENISINDELI